MTNGKGDQMGVHRRPEIRPRLRPCAEIGCGQLTAWHRQNPDAHSKEIYICFDHVSNFLTGLEGYEEAE